jgi:hypothetical protein
MISEIDTSRARPMTIDLIRSVDRELDLASGPGHPASGLKPGVWSPGKEAVAAADGHMFIADGTNNWESQYQGKTDTLETWVPKWLDLIQKRNEIAAQAGIQLLQFVVPEKQVLLPHIRWPDGRENGANRPLAHLLPALPPDAGLIYPETALNALLEEAPTHHRHDSHWNASGCLAAMRPLLARIAPEVHLDTLGLNVSLRNKPLDLTPHFFADPPPEEFLALEPNGVVMADNQNRARTGRYVGSFYALFNADAPDPRKVIVMGDSYSYSHGLTFVLSAIFRAVTFVWVKSIPWDTLLKEKADIVIWQHAERYMITLPVS